MGVDHRSEQRSLHQGSIATRSGEGRQEMRDLKEQKDDLKKMKEEENIANWT